MLIWIIVATLVAIVLFGVVASTTLRAADTGAQEALDGIDVQLIRRADLVPDLVHTVKDYASHERGVFGEATAARAAVVQAAGSHSVEQRAAAQARLDRAIFDVMAVAEAYPDLETSADFQHLQAELSDTEHALASARRDHDVAVRVLNQRVRTIPWLFFTRVAGVKVRASYDAPAGQGTAPADQP